MLENEVSELKTLVKQLLTEVNKLTNENEIFKKIFYSPDKPFQTKKINAFRYDITNETTDTTKETTNVTQNTVYVTMSTTDTTNETTDVTKETNDETNVTTVTNKETTEGEKEQVDNLQNSVVAFTAFATEFRDYNASDVILFDGIISNYGSHFNNNTSTFTCPYSGLYLFMLHVTNHTPKSIFAQIDINGVKVVSTHCVEHDLHEHEINRQCSNSIIIICEAGSEVKVTNKNNGCAMVGNSNRHSTFSGMLVRVL